MFASELFLSALCLVLVTTNAYPLNTFVEPEHDEAALPAGPSDSLSESMFGVINSDLDDSWEDFKHMYGKEYESPVDELLRRMIWEENFHKIENHNQEASNGLHSYTMGVNEFTDMTHAEFKELLGIGRNTVLRKNIRNEESFNNVDAKALPKSVDWRKQGLVTEVINQGQCGSSPYFSATGAMEGQHAKKTKKLVSLSAQQLIDCSLSEGNQGCNGGLMDSSFEYVIKNHGIDTTEAYPYEAQDGKCRFTKPGIGATFSSYKDLQPKNETAMQIAVAQIGPISMAFDASQASLQNYKDGVYSDPNCDNVNPDHGSLIIGYGVSTTQGDFWLIKNTWGKSWGMDGYLWLARNANNMCGVTNYGSYPLV